MKCFPIGMAWVLAILLGAATCAMANSWGLTGALLEAVSVVDTWDDYHTLSEQAGNAACAAAITMH